MSLLLLKLDLGKSSVDKCTYSVGQTVWVQTLELSLTNYVTISK